MKKLILALGLLMFGLWIGIEVCRKQDLRESLDASVSSATENEKPRSYWRPEELGENLSNRSPRELIELLEAKGDPIELRKAAIALGDWNLQTGETLTEDLAMRMRKIVSEWLAMCASPDVHTRSEGRQQILRAWRISADGLVHALSASPILLRETAVRSLVDMRDESIIGRMIEVARTTEDKGIRSLICRALSRMGDNTRLAVPGREIMSASDTDALFVAVVEPALHELGHRAMERR